MREIQDAYNELLRVPHDNPARALHCQKALAVLRDIIAWAQQRTSEEVQNAYEG
jgi:hypothetical protein